MAGVVGAVMAADIFLSAFRNLLDTLKLFFLGIIAGSVLCLLGMVLYTLYDREPVWRPGMPHWVTPPEFAPGEVAHLYWEGAKRLRSGRECETTVVRSVVDCGTHPVAEVPTSHREVGEIGRLPVYFVVPVTVPHDAQCAYQVTARNACGPLGSLFPFENPWPKVPFRTRKPVDGRVNTSVK